MRIVLPVSRSDFDHLPDWVEVADFLQCGGQHDLNIVTPKSIESEILDYKAQLEGIFQSVTIHAMEIDPAGGWPFAPNVFFWYAAKLMSQVPNQPWQLVELDCLPLYSNSFDAISNGYLTCGRPFYGNVGATPWRITDPTAPNYGKIVASRYGKEDKMMSGCAVYPGDIFQRPNFASKDGHGLLADFMKGEESSDEPWDMHLAPAMRADGVAHTEMLAQHWNTGNYRVEDGIIVCDALEHHEIYSSHPDWEKRKCGGKVNRSAVFIHGCKDDSLKNLIISGEIPGFVPVSRRASTTSTPSPETPESPKVEMLEAKVDQLASMFKEFMKISAGQADVQKTAPPILSAAVPAGTSGVKVSGANSYIASGSEGQTGLFSRAVELLSQKKYRIGELCKELDTQSALLEPLLEANGYELSGPARWVKLKELATA